MSCMLLLGVLLMMLTSVTCCCCVAVRLNVVMRVHYFCDSTSSAVRAVLRYWHCEVFVMWLNVYGVIFALTTHVVHSCCHVAGRSAGGVWLHEW